MASMHSSCFITSLMASPGAQCLGKNLPYQRQHIHYTDLLPIRLLPAEIFPLRSRSKGMALATASNWIFNFIIGMVSPDAFAGIHGYFYLIIAGFCLFSAGLAWFYYVETAGHTLEEIAIAFGDKAFLDSDEEIVAQSELRKGSVV